MNRRDLLWIGFGSLWIADGVLQAQPAMFTRQFVGAVLQPAAEGQPPWLARPLAEATGIWQAHAVAANLAAVLLELAIGALFLLGRAKPWSRVGLVLSIGWGIVVWVFGEGSGGLLAGPPSALTGAPGAAAAYLAVAILLLLPLRWWDGRILRWTRRALGGFWLLDALAQARPGTGYWTADGFGWTFQAAARQPQPAFVSRVIVDVATLVAGHPVAANALFVAVMVALGGAFLAGGEPGWAYVLAFAWLGFSWWVGQDFGAIFSGTGTDPGLAPPLGLLTLSVAPRPRRRALAARIVPTGPRGPLSAAPRPEAPSSAAFRRPSRLGPPVQGS